MAPGEHIIQTTSPALPRSALPRWRDALAPQPFAASPWSDADPIRSELFSSEKLVQHAAALALSQRAALARGDGHSLSGRIRYNAATLRRDYEMIARRAVSGRNITPAAQWFFDNYYLVERQLRLIRADLPGGYYRQLPKLRDGPLAGFPRITSMAWEFVAHTDSACEPATLVRFIEAYQRHEALTLGELWAFASMLRIVLIENLRRSADRIVSGRLQREAADAIADRLLGSPARAPEPLLRVVGGIAKPLPAALAVQLVQRLRDANPGADPAQLWLEQTLLADGVSPENLVRDELQRQSASNVTVRNIVTSLVSLAALDWAEIVESLSVVDAALRGGSSFAQMDFATRNRYRTAIEELARCSEHSEIEVARLALKAGHGSAASDRAAHDPGHYLIGTGRRDFERLLDFRPPWRGALQRTLIRAGIHGYLALVGVMSGAVLFGTAWALQSVAALQRLGLLLALSLPVSDLVLALVNSAYTRLITPKLLPAMDLGGLVPDQLRTIVVIPALLSTPPEAEELVRRLESHYLASARGELYFALLADGADAASAELPGDAALIDAGRRGIERLNRRYGAGNAGPRFLWLHRARRWNPAQGCWMGWERKRGKLHEFNRLLRGALDTSFSATSDLPPAITADVRYVLVLDADTQLAPLAAEKLIGKLAHPLNQAHFDPDVQRITAGYGIIQPRVAAGFPGERGGSLLQGLLADSPGLDPYAFAVSDIYQDLAGEGSFTGKGIYDLDAFEAALAGRIAENTILSHDMLEGLFARAALASDIEVLEAPPDRYDVAAAREHRWARGDWQLLPWLLEPSRRSALSTLGRWKILDNLRRSSIAPATLLALVLSWTLPAPLGAWFSLTLAGALALPPLLPSLLALRDRPRHMLQANARHALVRELRLAATLWGLRLALLADRAWSMTDAIARTLLRVAITRRHLLDWTSAAQSRRFSRLDIGSYAVRMSGGIGLCLLLAAALLYAAPGHLWLAAPWLVLWLMAPWIARAVSLPHGATDEAALLPAQSIALRGIARRTWSFFERFVSVADQHLPPDNFQETPTPVIAHRTSPTNVGLYLLSAASAYQFGWLGITDWIERLEASFESLQRLERHRGHFFNWYDTQTLRPLEPRYVSTVDSGNLAGHLLALANALEAASRRPLWGFERLTGIRDALMLTPSATSVRAPALTRFETVVAAQTSNIDLPQRLRSIESLLDDQFHAATALAAHDGIWFEAAASCVRSHCRDLERLHASALGASAQATLIDLAGGPPTAQSATHARALLTRLTNLAMAARRLAYDMDFGFLLDSERLLLAIGYRIAEASLDRGAYDLLASEARLASFIAIAKGDVPARHWFRLGRAMVPIDTGAALTSWAGSMFEYLMPSLVMAEPHGSLLDSSNRAAVRCQREFGRARDMPWGISESAYNQRDFEQVYQYSTFGMPALGLKPGLEDDAVVAPYATGLAAMIDPVGAMANYELLRRLGGCGVYGYYESLDFTPRRLAEGERLAVVRAYMAHHQGMTLIALTNTLLGGVMREYFHAEPVVRAAELLLQERPPRAVEEPPPSAVAAATAGMHPALPGTRRRRLDTWCPRTAQTQLLSNGRYSVMVNAAGGGSSRCGDLAVTRWSEDTTRDDCGQVVFIRDCDSGSIWSGGFHPTARRPDAYHVSFAEDRVEIARRDGSLATTLEILVSPEHDAEARRVSISNRGLWTREIEVTSYVELVLASAAADRAHRVFSGLFVQTEYVPGLDGLLAWRRGRAEADRPVWAAHIAVVEGDSVGAGEHETDRARFIGRGRRIGSPQALLGSEPLSGSVGAVLDPVFGLRRRLKLARGASARVTFWTVMADSRDAALQIADQCRDPSAFGRASTLAWTRVQVQLHHLGISPEDANLFQRLAAHIFYFDRPMRSGSEVLRANQAGASALWVHGVSGDLPIILATIDDGEQLELIRQLLRAHEYWALQNLAVDLVIINETAHSYSQELQTALDTLVRTSRVPRPQSAATPKGAIYVLRAELISALSRQALSTAARAVLVGRRGTLTEQLDRRESTAANPTTAPVAAQRIRQAPPSVRHVETLELFNGLGGFADSGREYVTVLRAGQCTPQPWINVIAQPEFGFQVSAEGAGFTWSRNSRQNALTAWSNDPVCDPNPEAFYVRDEESGEIWCPTASPIRDPEGSYVARHGQGYSSFEYESRGIELRLRQFVPLGAACKVSMLRLRNQSARPRRISVCAYVEWTLGSARAATAPFIVTEQCPTTGALLARNPWNTDFAERVAFLDMAGAQSSATADRREFLGPDGTMDSPAALRAGAPLALRVGAGLDPCAALLTRFELPADGVLEIAVFLGQAPDGPAATAMIGACRAWNLEQQWQQLGQHWDAVLGAVQVSTPDRSLDLLLNRWLLYQTLSCRMWARAAFYQASGAYGFRDQLQDGMALVIAAPQITRAHLLRAAGRQFPEGDVQHWWMPENGRGVRTRISDDRVWLAYCVSQYIQATGDSGLLDERVPFLAGDPLEAGALERYFEPGIDPSEASLFEHCARALDTSLANGEHGLPLIGSGDWNDGFNAVGAAGRGESVWLGWFLYATLESFAALAAARGDGAHVERWRAHSATLRTQLEQSGWDGDWYRRGYFDDGTPLGSAANAECRIDSIAQSWAVLSRAAHPARAAHAMAGVLDLLWDPKEPLALLFTPAFSQGQPDPGYIKAYPAGIRENGGQYSHAAIWSLMAFAQLGDGERAKQWFDAVNPLSRTRDPAAVARYKLEPYAVAADIYAGEQFEQHAGRGGWSWYTGSAGWLYRAGLESILGFRLQADVLAIEPCVPRNWRRYDVEFRFRSTLYRITVTNPFGVSTGVNHAELDQRTILRSPIRLPLVDDGVVHEIRVVMG